MRALLALILIAISGWAALRYLERTRPQDLPWTPLDLAAPLGRATAWKLASLADDPAWCRRVLTIDGVAFEPVPDRQTAPGCGWRGAVRLTGSEWRPRGPVMTCPLAAAVTVWQRHVVRPAARRHLASNLTGLDHYGTYSCRAVAGSPRASEHSTTNAVDIAGFRTVRGTPLGLLRDWNGASERAAFLREVQEGGCRVFGTTLGPDYNAAHRDHFHFDMAGWSFCP